MFTEDDFDSLIPKIVFEWNEINGAKNYKFEIRNTAGKTLVSKTVSTNKFTLSSDDLSLVSDNDTYTWMVTATAVSGKETYESKVAERTFSVQIEDSETASLDTDNLIIF